MSAARALLALDLKGITRDAVLITNIGASIVGTLIITIIGIYKADTNWADWFPAMVAMSLITNPPAYGVLFAFLMVDEKDTGVRSALAVTPIAKHTTILTRSTLSVGIMLVWPMISVAIMNSSWQALHIPPLHLFMVVASVALFAPIVTLSVAALASNKVEALSIFKGISFVSLAALALYFVDPNAAYRPAFLLIPASWAIHAFDAFRQGDITSGYWWSAGGILIHVTLLAITIKFYFKQLYKD
mgnify:CR=1 FL=1